MTRLTPSQRLHALAICDDMLATTAKLAADFAKMKEAAEQFNNDIQESRGGGESRRPAATRQRSATATWDAGSSDYQPNLDRTALGNRDKAHRAAGVAPGPRDLIDDSYDRVLADVGRVMGEG